MAKNTKGIVRRIDNVGRLVIPIELYRQAGFVGREEEVDIVPTEEGILIRRCEQNNIISDIRSVIDKYEYDGVNTDLVKDLKKLVEA